MTLTFRKTLNISIITPVLNEEQHLTRFLDSLSTANIYEHILVDGGSTDQTCSLIKNYPVRLIHSAPGRGTQQNVGAAAASGDILLFLHCDTLLPEHFAQDIEQILQQPGIAAGAFLLAIAHTNRAYRIVEWGANLRSRLLQLPYGDQALFMKKSDFISAGGFPNQPILEEIPLLKRLRKLGKIALTTTTVTTSARRWQRLGIVKTTMRNQEILLKLYLGYPPSQLAKLYSRDDGSG
jgi:rSAM/selenodomain-associated transferase 2